MICTLPPASGKASGSSKWWIASGLFSVVLVIYVLSSPGRIDIIDGQARYDVSHNWLLEGRPVLRDPWIASFMGVPGRDGLRYSYYGAPASIFSMPLVGLGQLIDTPTREASRFLFSLTSSFFGAGIALVLFLFYLELGVPQREAMVWTIVSSFATLIWPSSTSTFDNAQHAFFVLAALYLGFLSSKRASKILAASSGLLAAVLILYQEYFLLLIPAIAASTLKWTSDTPTLSASKGKSWYSGFFSDLYRDLRSAFELMRTALRGPGEARASCIRFSLSFLIAIIIGLGLSFAYNNLRFASYLDDGKLRPQFHILPLFGNPVAGLSTLFFSPGKSVFLYSPPLILSLLGMVYLRRLHRELTLAIFAASLLLVSFISWILFVGGDWCWGPRYLVPLLPLWALALPFRSGRLRRDVAILIVGIGLIVQVLALSVENQRFFFQRALKPYFWAEDPWFYFKHSALFARIGETWSLTSGLPPSARFFNSIPIPDWCTYAILGPTVPRHLVPQWMSNFKIYYLPRPWPLWMPWIRPSLRPINLQVWIWALSGILGIGIAFICRGFRLSLNGGTALTGGANKEVIVQ